MHALHVAATKLNMTCTTTPRLTYPCKAGSEQIAGEPFQHFLHVANAFHPVLKPRARQQHALNHLQCCAFCKVGNKRLAMADGSFLTVDMQNG